MLILTKWLVDSSTTSDQVRLYGHEGDSSSITAGRQYLLRDILTDLVSPFGLSHSEIVAWSAHSIARTPDALTNYEGGYPMYETETDILQALNMGEFPALIEQYQPQHPSSGFSHFRVAECACSRCIPQTSFGMVASGVLKARSRRANQKPIPTKHMQNAFGHSEAYFNLRSSRSALRLRYPVAVVEILF
jgi:hypothetical protein